MPTTTLTPDELQLLASARAARVPIDPAPLGEQFAALRAMTRRERLLAAHHGELTIQQLCKWAAMAPEEVPLIDGEFFFIAAELADYEDADGNLPGSGRRPRTNRPHRPATA